MFLIDEKNRITMVSGDTAIISFGVDVKLKTGDKVTFTVKKSSKEESPILIQKVIEEFKEDGTAVIVLEESDTANLKAGNYLYEVEVRLGIGIINTVIPATKFKIIADLNHKN